MILFRKTLRELLEDKKKIFRIRVGGYRITYAVFADKKIIIITDIDKRGRIYKK